MSAWIKRWLWIPVMAPVMWAGWLLVLSADRLFRHNYSDKFAPPTTADYTRAAVTFWGALLTPLIVGLVAGIVAFRRKYPPRWSILEAVIVAFPILTLFAGVLIESFVIVASLLLGGTIVMTLHNMGACLGQRRWGKAAFSALVICGGVLYLLWLYAFIIYVDT